MDSTFGLDIDGSPLVFDQTSFILNTEQLSQEIQLNGGVGERFRYTAGLYYFDEDGFQADRVPIADGLIQVAGGFDHDTEAKSLFGEANFDLTESLTINLGVRVTEEDKTVQLDQQNLNPDFYIEQGAPTIIFPRQNDFTFLAPAEPLNASFDNTSARAGLSWQVNDAVFTYFTYSQGFKSGGFTTRLTEPFNPALIPPNPGPEVLTQLDFDEETADTFELGFKSQFMGNRVRLNAALFFNTYNDIQIVVQRGVSPSNENVAEAEIKGLQVELEAVPNDWLRINASLGLLDAEYSEIQTTGNLTGRFGSITTATKLANTPDLTGSLAINAAFSDAVSGNVNFTYVDDVYNDVFNTPVLFQKAYSLLGASLVYERDDGNWSAILGVNNITDERYIVSGFEAGALPFTTASYGRPKEWYLTIRYTY
jgi:iron complex outermembrane receptor protein